MRTTAWDRADELPDLGQYRSIHWQAHALGNPCSRGPGPTDWMYEGIVELRPGDARALAGTYEWQSVTGVASASSPGPQIWPSLASFVRADARWTHSDAYDNLEPQSRWRHLYLDADHALALFILEDH